MKRKTLKPQRRGATQRFAENFVSLGTALIRHAIQGEQKTVAVARIRARADLDLRASAKARAFVETAANDRLGMGATGETRLH